MIKNADSSDYFLLLSEHKCKNIYDSTFARWFFEKYRKIPMCNSVRCEHCRKCKLLVKVSECDKPYIHTSVKIYRFVLPYYGLYKCDRRKCDRAFRQWLTRNYGDWTYFRSTEFQKALLHINYVAYFDRPIDCETVAGKWFSLATEKLQVEKNIQDVCVEPITDVGGWASYVTKWNWHSPENFLPPSWMCSQPYRFANNWKSYWSAHPKPPTMPQDSLPWGA